MRHTLRVRLLAAGLLVLAALPASAAETIVISDPVVMRGAAVAETAQGFVGSTATFTITVASNGSGHVFLDTFPLTQIDMQGSARLAARVASQVTGKALHDHDFFFVIRSGSTQIGGPSAGATLTVGAIAALQGWQVRPDVLMTGTIQPDGSVGPVGGIPEKAQAAASAGMRRFLFPAGEDVQPLSSTPGATVSMPQYCRDALRIECLPVEDVYAAVENMTDHAFVRTPVTGDVTGEAFRQRLGPLSEELLQGARTLVAEARFEASRIESPEGRAALSRVAEDAAATLNRAESAYSNGTYYTAASLSFQASIAAHDGRDRARLAQSTDAMAGIRAIVEEARRRVEGARAAIDAAPVQTSSQFETAGAAQVRIMEAESRLADARNVMENGSNPALAVYEAAYAVERASTATWWLKLGLDAPQGGVVSTEALEGAARDSVTTATEQVAYVAAVFSAQPVGVALAPAQEKLDEAERAMARGYFAAAMLNAIEAQVRSSNVLVLSSFGAIPPSRMDAARLEAARAIQAARARGAEPILAQSEYEFGQALDDDVEEYTFYGLARVTANLAGLPDVFGANGRAAESRFQGAPSSIGVEPQWVAAALVVGVALGSLFGLSLGSSRRKESEPGVGTIQRVKPEPRHSSALQLEEWRE